MELWQSPTVPMDWVMLRDRHAARNAPAVYWVPWSVMDHPSSRRERRLAPAGA
jgi:hypothetical protein